MKKKLLVLSASAILASNFVFDNNASAVVRKTEHESDALNKIWNGNNTATREQYEDNFKKFTNNLSLNEHGGYDEPEYKVAYQKYQDRFLGELDAFNKLILKGHPSNGGLTIDKYNNIRKSLEENQDKFMYEVFKIENENPELKRFDDNQFDKGLDLVYNLEDQALMSARAFWGSAYKDARDDLYAKLDLIVGTTPDERRAKLPTNQRMLNEMSENLETIIDEFFKDIKLERPSKIEPLTKYNKDNLEVLKKVRDDAQKAKDDIRYRDPNVEKRAKKAEEKLAELTKNSKDAKAKADTKRKLSSKSALQKSYRKNPEAFSHKQLKNELLITFPDSNRQLPTHIVTSTTQPILKQQVKEEKVDVLKSKRPESTLKGMEGESAPVTVVSEPAIKATSAPQQKVVEGNTSFSGSNNNLSGMGGESKEVSFTYDSQPVDFDIITESNEIVLDQHSDIKVSGFTTGESIEDSRPSNEVKK